MKKLLAMALAVAMTLSLAACGSSSSSSGSAGSAAGSASSAGSASGSQGGDAADFKVGAIYITSQQDTAGYTYQHHKGITTAMENLGMDVDSQLLIVDGVPDTDDTAVSNAIDTLASQGCQMIIGISFGYLNAMEAAAAKPEYADIIFSHGTGYLSNPDNFNNYFGRIYQARYLTGIAAGLKSLETGNNSLGYVAAFNTDYAETCSGINAFTMGALAVNPEATVTVKVLNTWADETLERQTAQALIDSGCGVIAQHCDSAQPQLAAQEAGVFGCGYNSDMTEQAPEGHITAAIWHWDVYYQAAIEAAMQGKEHFMSTIGEAYYTGLAEGLVGISPINEAVAAPGTQAAVDAVSELIVSGEWDVFSGVKLNITVNEDGTATVEQVEADLVDTEGNVIVEAGGPSVDDSVIKGSMNYNVEGVIVG